MPKVVIAFGTRPEATKLAPVILELRQRPEIEPIMLVTGQHREQLKAGLNVFGLQPDADLAVMMEKQTLPELMARIVPQAAQKLRELKADYVVVQGDTLTTFAVALAAFFENIRIAHVEAGLRSHDLREPFPEEANRRLTSVITDLDLPPTKLAKANLLNEGKNEERIIITGQTAVDAIRWVAARAKLPAEWHNKRLVTVTMHRRENWPILQDLAQALAKVAEHNPEFTFVYPVHLNPIVREAVWPILAKIPNFVLVEPLDYGPMAALIKASELLLTDSGGLQEEGASLNVPVLVLRNVTERPEGVEAGVLRLAGTEPQKIVQISDELLKNETLRQEMKTKKNPYGDGLAAKRVSQAIAWRLGLADRPIDYEE